MKLSKYFDSIPNSDFFTFFPPRKSQTNKTKISLTFRNRCFWVFEQMNDFFFAGECVQCSGKKSVLEVLNMTLTKNMNSVARPCNVIKPQHLFHQWIKKLGGHRWVRRTLFYEIEQAAAILGLFGNVPKWGTLGTRYPWRTYIELFTLFNLGGVWNQNWIVLSWMCHVKGSETQTNFTTWPEGAQENIKGTCSNLNLKSAILVRSSRFGDKF